MKAPFGRKKNNYKEIRLCNNTDYNRVGLNNYVEVV